MTADQIVQFIGERETFNRVDMARLNEMLIELPLEDFSDVRAWAMEAVALRVNDPLYAGDLDPID